jgi:hypothetical protein
MTGDANTVTVNRGGSDTINGGTSIVINDQYEVYTFILDDSAGEWLATGGLASGISAGDGIDVAAGVVSADLKANGGLVIESTELALDLAASSITGSLAESDYDTPTAITVANEATDTTCFLGFFTAATGDLGPKTNAGLTYNSSTGDVSIPTASAYHSGNWSWEENGNVIYWKLSDVTEWYMDSNEFYGGNINLYNGVTGATVASYRFNTDQDTGVGTSGADSVSFVAGGVEGLRVTETGGTTIDWGIGATSIINDVSGTTTLQNVDALDVTTEATIEAAIDTLANLTSASALATVGTITSGTWQGTVVAEAYLPDASESAEGVVELATTAEVDTGTDAVRPICPDQLQASKRNIRYVAIRLVKEDTDVAVQQYGGDFTVPFSGTILQDDTLHDQLAAVTDTAGTTGTMVVDIHLNGTTIMTTNKLDIETTEKGTQTAATQPDLTTTSVSAGDILTFHVDAIHTTAAKGLTILMAIREN